jgi:hypothetical protein
VPSKHTVGGSNPFGQASFINNTMSIRNKINNRLDELEKLMCNQKHISNPDIIIDCIESITKFWSVLNDEEKDFVECVKYALDTKLEWKYD